MTETPHRRWQRLYRRGYVGLLARWFRYGRGPLSALVARLRPRARWRTPRFATLPDAARWLERALVWRLDPLYGIFDIVIGLDNAAYQLATTGHVRDDCDGLAHVSAQVVAPFADTRTDGQPGVLIATFILDPVRVKPLYCAHVMTFFRRQGVWRAVSNHILEGDEWPTLHAALTQNSYVRTYGPPQYVEVRDWQMLSQRSRWALAAATGAEAIAQMAARLDNALFSSFSPSAV